MKRICQGVYLTCGGGTSNDSDAMGYLVEADGLVLIDAGAEPSSGVHILDGIATSFDADRITHLILTHGHVDHIGGVSKIVSRTDCKVICHAQDAAAIRTGDPVKTAADWYEIKLPPVRVDEELAGEEGVVAGLRWIHIPGHTPGSIALTYESRDGLVLFGQDIHGPFSPQFDSNIDQWAASMRRLIDLGADILCEGHFGIYRSKEKVRRFIQGHLTANGFSL